MQVPQQLMGDVYQKITERLALLGSVGWQNWNQFRSAAHPPEGAARIAGAARRSAGAARRNLWLVHRRLRHSRPEGREGAARGISGIDGDALREVQSRQPSRCTVLYEVRGEDRDRLFLLRHGQSR
jgi:hypothetical protein